MEQAVAEPSSTHAPGSGLRANILSPVETLAQSISTIAPTATPAMTVPLVFAQAGNGTWLAYVLAVAAILLIAFCIARFARETCSSGSLYTYATSSLPPLASGVAGWALLLAYIATAGSVTGGFINYANVLLQVFTHHQAPTALLAAICLCASTFIAYRDVQVSARLMLWIEALSILVIAVILILLVIKNGFHLDHAQLDLVHVKPSSVRLGVVLAIFSFVGFESATTLGAEARNPLKTIPRAVIQSALFAGVFFILCAYLETLGMAQAHQDLGQSTAPFHTLATLVGLGPFGTVIDLGALVSMFACNLACITAAARVLLRMAQNGIAHNRLGTTHHRNATPHLAVLAIGAFTLIPVVVLALRGVSSLDIYGWLGSLAVYGFLTTYGLAVLALPIFLKRVHRLTPATLALALAAALAIIAALAGTLYPIPDSPYNWLPYVYLGYLLLGLAWQAQTTRQAQALS